MPKKERMVIKMRKKLVDTMQDEVNEQRVTMESLEDERDRQKDEDAAKRRRTRRRAIIAFIILVLIMLTFGSMYAYFSRKPKDEDTTSKFEVELEDSEFHEKYKGIEKKDNVDMVVYFGATLTEENPYYTLGALSSNFGNYYTQITIYEGDKQIYQSKMCEAKSKDENYQFSVDLYKLLGVGTHEIKINQQGFYVDTLAPTNQASQTVVIECK